MDDQIGIGCGEAIHEVKALLGGLQEKHKLELADVESQRARLEIAEDGLAKTNADIDACMRIIEMLTMRGMQGLSSLPSALPVDDAEPTCGRATLRDIKECETQYEGLLRMAQLNDGIVVLSDAADLWLALGRSTGLKVSVLTAYRRGIKRTGDWIKIRKGVYRLKAFMNVQDGELTQCPAENDDVPEENLGIEMAAD